MRELFVSFFLVLATFQLTYGESIILGVAEDPNHSSKTSMNPIARVLFHKENGKWVSLDTEKKQKALGLERIKWTIAFDGRNLGNLITIDDMGLKHPDCSWCFPRDKFFRIENVNKFPKLGNKHKRFWNWAGLPNNRPLVLVNAPNYKDKDNWKRFRPSKNILSRIFPKLKESMKKGFFCKGVKIDLTQNNFELYRSYNNINGEMLVSAGIRKKLLTKGCYSADDFDNGLIWFYLGKKIKLIGDGLDLLDAGDYDSDGKVELLFHYSGYNLDGYTLFDNGFEERVDYRWSYH